MMISLLCVVDGDQYRRLGPAEKTSYFSCYHRKNRTVASTASAAQRIEQAAQGVVVEFVHQFEQFAQLAARSIAPGLFRPSRANQAR
jgi:hypothetical protein